MDNGGQRAQAQEVDTVRRPDRQGILGIELEDAATRSWWVGTLGLLAGVMQQWHFVGILGDEVRYESDTFSAPYSWGHLPLGRTMRPRNEWAPGMDAALEAVRAEIVDDGWVLDGHGEQAWQDRYRKQPG
jgi:hypothetical protein